MHRGLRDRKGVQRKLRSNLISRQLREPMCRDDPSLSSIGISRHLLCGIGGEILPRLRSQLDVQLLHGRVE